MGQRANLITVEDGEYILRYDHWCANRLDKILFWGPGHALVFIEAQDRVGEEGWLDEIWAEGGVVLDLDNKHLLWWGGESILYDVPLRRVYQRLMRKVWEGWTMEWAHRGIVDIGEYVGYPTEKLLTDRNILSDSVKLDPVEKGQIQVVCDEPIFVETDTIGSICKVDGRKELYVLPFNAENYLRNGIDLVRQCKETAGKQRVVWDECNHYGDFPTGGFYVDEPRKTVEFWSARNCPNVVQDLKTAWDDWEVVWHQDS